jgi:hypothetical protein
MARLKAQRIRLQLHTIASKVSLINFSFLTYFFVVGLINLVFKVAKRIIKSYLREQIVRPAQTEVWLSIHVQLNICVFSVANFFPLLNSRPLSR